MQLLQKKKKTEIPSTHSSRATSQPQKLFSKHLLYSTYSIQNLLYTLQFNVRYQSQVRALPYAIRSRVMPRYQVDAHAACWSNHMDSSPGKRRAKRVIFISFQVSTSCFTSLQGPTMCFTYFQVPVRYITSFSALKWSN